MTGLLHASKKDIPLIVHILAPAFSDNQSVNRCIKQDSRRVQRIENQVKYATMLSLRSHMAYLNATKTGAILCTLSDGKKATILDDLYYLFYVSGLKLGLQLMKREKALQQILPKSTNCHIWFIGVDKTVQGKGTGTKMIEDVKKICQEQHLPIYLETSNPRNFRFYEKNGFTLYQKIKLPMDDFELYFYSWEPRQ